MRTFLLLLSLVLFSFCCSAQEVLLQVAKNYFRSNPFDREFSRFLHHLMNDPALQISTVSKRTDSSFFYLRGSYTRHNPFFFKAKRTEIVIAEQEVILNDSLPLTDTLILYQLAGYSEEGSEGVKDVKEEFDRFDRKYLKKFYRSDLNQLKKGNEITGVIRNYFLRFSYIAPLSAAWQEIPNKKENVFVITLRFKVSGNGAVLPVSPDSP
jgi:hypothetical protein